MKINEIKVNDYLTKSNLPSSDYVINPYVGCPHGCKYCYASFMKRFTGHKENWGEFVDVKKCDKKINLKKISGKNVFYHQLLIVIMNMKKNILLLEIPISESQLIEIINENLNLTNITRLELEIK